MATSGTNSPPATLALTGPRAEPAAEAPSTVVVRLGLVGANPEAAMTGEEPLPGRVNYFLGDDPTRWHRGIPTFASVVSRGVYPGVDLVWYGHQGILEHDFVLAPGTDPGVVTLAVDGADEVSLDPDGHLVISTPLGELRQHRPVAYQDVDGERRPVDAGYVLLEENRVGFRLGPYDPAHPLVIDPVLEYSTYLGGSGEDFGVGVAVGDDGEVWITGETNSSGPAPGGFPTVAPLQGGNAGATDVFVAKLED